MQKKLIEIIVILLGVYIEIAEVMRRKGQKKRKEKQKAKNKERPG